MRQFFASVKVVVLLFGSLFFSISSLSAQWQQTSGPAGKEIADSFAEGDTAYVATGGGLYRSTDAAQSWQLIAFPGESVNHIWAHGSILLAGIVDSAVGSYVGSDVYRSSDRGASWNLVTDGLFHNAISIWAFGAQDSVLYISASLVFPTGYTLLHSTDQGISWVGIANGPTAWVTGLANAGDTMFASTVEGIFVKNANFPWQRVTGFTHSVVATSIFYDGSTLYSGTSDGMYASIDRGSSWTLSLSVIDAHRIASIEEAGHPNPTVLADDSSNYFFSTDRGAHWTFTQPREGLNHVSIASIQSSPTAGVFLLCTGNHIYTLPDPFQFATEADSGIINADVYTLQFIGGALYAETPSGFDRSKDGGATWTPFATKILPGSVTQIVASGNVIFVGGTGLYRTTNDGVSWDTLKGGLGGFQLVTALAASASHLYAGSSSLLSSSLFSSTDSGNSWHRTDTTLQGLIYSIYARDSLVLVFASDGMAQSLDYGQTWSVMPALTYYTLFGETIAGNGSVILTSVNGLSRSVDGGVTWRPVNIAISDPSKIESVSMNGNTALAGTAEGVFVSLDAGLNWKRTNDGLMTQTPGIVSDRTYAYAGTLGSSVWKAPVTTLGITAPVVADNSRLLSNYPNPFQSQTNIDVSTTKQEHISLEIYDGLGRRVQTLFDGIASAGHQAFQFQGANLVNGVYFVLLHRAEGSTTLPITLRK